MAARRILIKPRASFALLCRPLPADSESRVRSSEQRSDSPSPPCPHTIAHSTLSVPTWTRGRESGASRRGCTARGMPTAYAVRRARLASDDLHDWMEHSPTSATGTAWERTPWRATQRAEAIVPGGVSAWPSRCAKSKMNDTDARLWHPSSASTACGAAGPQTYECPGEPDKPYSGHALRAPRRSWRRSPLRRRAQVCKRHAGRHL